MSQATNVEECGYECARLYSRKMIHFETNSNGRTWCSCLEGCSHNSYGTATKQYALITGN